MLLPRFDFHDPASVQEALDLKKTYRENARILAGGTDLLVHLKKDLVSVEHLISVTKIDELLKIEEKGGDITIGACVTMASLAASGLIGEKLPALKQGAQSLGNHLIRNKATIGGNACNASPAGDTLCALLIYDAAVILQNSEGAREVPVSDFFVGPGKSCINDDELLTGFRIAVPPAGSGADYIQLGKRKSSEINVVNVASYIEIDPANQNILNARIALGSVAPTPIRGAKAEQVLAGKTADDTVFFEAAEAARRDDCKPIDDFRGTAGYRQAMIGVLTRRTLAAALAQAQGK
ncbi:MAG: xanthine dehydrogenase family protein subunit M [Desulfobacteraceae bacterium]|nr:MAG: xanthine dehydrogenase family protein subunit M [Desulfobacteraceae bacterium]